MMSAGLALTDIFRADFRTSRDADQINTELQAALGLDFRYQAARLAISMSLSDPSQPPPAPDLLGKPIRGETLLGQEEVEVGLWVALLGAHAGGASLTKRQALDLVAAHWRRGAARLHRELAHHGSASTAFLLALAGQAPGSESNAAMARG